MLQKIIAIVFLLFSLMACSKLTFDGQQMKNSGINNLKQVDDRIYISGQPSQEQLEVAAKSGVKHIINLRPVAELAWDEKAFVEAQGMNYIHIPVDGASGVSEQNVNLFIQALNNVKDETALIHCGSGNRVGALVAIDAAINNKNDLESAIAKGKDWGLTRLEPFVRNFIQSQ